MIGTTSLPESSTVSFLFRARQVRVSLLARCDAVGLRIKMFNLRNLTRLMGLSPLAARSLDKNNLNNAIAIKALGFASVHGSLKDSDRVFTNLYGR